MSDFLRGLLAMYAVAGIGSALIYLLMLRHAPKPGVSDVLKIGTLLALGPVTGWLMLWGSIHERVERSRQDAVIKTHLKDLMTEVEQQIAKHKAERDRPISPPHRFDRHLWN